MTTDNKSKISLTEKNRNRSDRRLLTKFGLQEIGMQKQLKLLRRKHQNELIRLANYQLKADKVKSLKEKIYPVIDNSTDESNLRYEEYDLLQFHNFITERKSDLKNDLYELEKAKSLKCFTEKRKKGSIKKEKEQKWQEERALRNLQLKSLDSALYRQKILDDLETKENIHNKNRQRIINKKLEIDARKKKKLQEKEDEIKKAKEKEKLIQLEKINYYNNIYSQKNNYNEKWKAFQKSKKTELERFEKDRREKISQIREILEKRDIDKKTKLQNIKKELPNIPEGSTVRKQIIEEMKKEKEPDEDMIILLNIKNNELSEIREDQKKKSEEKKKNEQKEKRRKAMEKQKEKEKQKEQNIISSELEIIEAVQKYKSKRYEEFFEKVKNEKMKEKEREEKLAEEKDEEKKMKLEKKFLEERGKVALDLRKEYSQIEVEAICYEKKLREESKEKK